MESIPEKEAPSGLPQNAPEGGPLGVPEADPEGTDTTPGPESMPGIPDEGEPPSSG